MALASTEFMPRLKARASELFPGLAIAGLVAVAAQFLSDHYGAPAMLMAILLGMPLHFLAEEERTAPGVIFSGSTLLRMGVALLGVRVSVAMLQDLGLTYIELIVLAVAATILVSLAAAPLFGRRRTFGLLSGGAVAICGASAALAIASVLPKEKAGEDDLAFTVVGVTVLSTLAMIAYPILASALGLTLDETGVFLGATIHDVAQVVGAGYSVSDPTGDLATLVKLVRVTLLAPVVLIASLVLRRASQAGGKRPPILPAFVIAFLVLAALNSAGVLPATLIDLVNNVSRWMLLTAIAAVGMKTSIPALRQVGGSAIALLSAQTGFLAVFVLIGLWLFRVF